MSTQPKDGRSQVSGPKLPGDAEVSELQFKAAEGAAKVKAKETFSKLGLDRFEGAVDNDFMNDNSGQMEMADRAVSIVVAIVVAGLLAAFLLPIAIEEISGVETTGWDGGAAALWDILPVMIVLAIFLFFVTVALRQRK